MPVTIEATIGESLKRASDQLRRAGVPNDVLDAQTLLAEAIGQDRTYLIIHYHQQLADETLARYQVLVERRAAGEPLQYITGHQQFYGLEFAVTPDVLIPRPETELLVEEVIRLTQAHLAPLPLLIVDVGTGSGCIAVSVARELDRARVIASDISPEALSVARHNAEKHDLEDRIEFVPSDLFEALAEKERADFILSNPPYVAAHELPTLQREVRDWEPHLALTDFGDGLTFYRRLLTEAPKYLKPGGYLLCEIGYGQADAILAMVNDRVWQVPRLLDDLQGIPRTLVLQVREAL